MRKVNKKRLFILLFCLSFLTTGTVALAHSRALTYNFTHHIPSGVVYVGRDGTVTLELTTTKWGDNKFWVKQSISNMFSSTYVASKYFYKSLGDTQTVTFSEKKGEHYVFDFWKADNNNSIVGSGGISW